METQPFQYPPAGAGEPSVLKELTAVPGVGLAISIPAAKQHFLALLDLVASGQTITLTTDGQPKAVFAPVGGGSAGAVFTGTRRHLESMPPWRGGATAEETVREDREGRG